MTSITNRKDDSMRVFALALGVMLAMPLAAAADNLSGVFQFKQARRSVDRDVDGVWGEEAFRDPDMRPASIYEYQLKDRHRDFLISQIWNYECTNTDCPTRLVRIGIDGKKTIVIDDMMHQVIPPDQPDFQNSLASKVTGAYARAPFKLIDNGKTLSNGDYSFDVRSD